MRGLPRSVTATTVMALLLVLAGCARDQGLRPAPQAQVVQGAKGLAWNRADNVVVLVRSGAWRGEPHDLSSVVTPVRVTIRNRADRPVWVMYRAFSLVTPAGRTLGPLSPLQMHAAGPRRHLLAPQATFLYDRFLIAPYYTRFYPGVSVSPDQLPAYDPTLFDAYVAQRVPLPTEDMLRRSLPEGVIAPGASVSGFLFFPPLAGEAGTVRFTADLVVEGSDRAARVEIPFVNR